MGDRSPYTISVSMGLAGEPWKSLDALEDRLLRLLDETGIPSDLSTDEALLAFADAKSDTLEWYAFIAISSIDACRECYNLGHHEAAATYAIQAVAMGIRADPGSADAIAAKLQAQFRELRAKQSAGGRKGAQTRKEKIESRNEGWKRNARDFKRHHPNWNAWRIAERLALETKPPRSTRTVYDVIRPALKS